MQTTLPSGGVDHVPVPPRLTLTLSERWEALASELKERERKGIIVAPKKKGSTVANSLMSPFRYPFLLSFFQGPPGEWKTMASLRDPASSVTAPVLEKVTRAYDEDFLRAPVGSERSCVSGPRCICHQIPGWPSGVSLREWYLPSNLEVCHRTRQWADDRQECLLCMLLSVNKAYFNARASQAPPLPEVVLAPFYHVTDVPGEYRSQDCLFTHERCYAGLWAPVLLLKLHYYRYRPREGPSGPLPALECLAPQPGGAGQNFH